MLCEIKPINNIYFKIISLLGKEKINYFFTLFFPLIVNQCSFQLYTHRMIISVM